jgi:hypothetical protein
MKKNTKLLTAISTAAITLSLITPAAVSVSAAQAIPTTPPTSASTSNSDSWSNAGNWSPNQIAKFLSENNDQHYFTNESILNALKQNNPEAYAKLPANVIQESLQQDLLRQGGTYVKGTKNGFTLYINSALVKIAKIVGGAAIAGAVASTVASLGLSAGPAAVISTGIAGVIALIPSDRGAWFKFNSRGQILSFGKQ